MSNAGTRPSVRPNLTAGVTIASAGILALSLVPAPPDVRGARVDIAAVRLADVAWPSAAVSTALVETFISDQARKLVPVTAAATAGATDITAGGVATPFTVNSAINQPIKPERVDAVAPSATTSAAGLAAIPEALLPIIGPIILFGAIAFGFLVVLPVEWFVGTVYEALKKVFPGLPPLHLPGTVSAPADANATIVPTLTSGSQLSSSTRGDDVSDAPVTAGTGHRGINLAAPHRAVGRVQAGARHLIDDTVAAVKSVTGNGRTVVRSTGTDNGSTAVTPNSVRRTPVRSAGTDNGSTAVTPNSVRKTPVGDAVNKARKVINKVVNQVSGSPRKNLSGDAGDS